MAWLRLTKDPFPPLSIRYHTGRVDALEWESGWTHRNAAIIASTAEKPLLNQLRLELEDYFEGKAVSFDWPLDWSQGTAFQQKVWKTLQRVPYGETRSYQWVAEQIGSPKAVRAVGQANGTNPFPIVVPCHRIIQKDGSIGGYSGGVEIKRALLELEKNGNL